MQMPLFLCVYFIIFVVHNYNLQINENYLTIISKSKDGDRGQGWPEGSIFNSNYTNV